MFRSIVVPFDRSPASDRGVRIAVALARRAELPVRLLHVCRPHEDIAAAEAMLHEVARRSFPVSCTATVLTDADLDGALLTALERRPDSLVVLGTRARRLAELVLGSLPESLLTAGRPLLLAGPYVDPTRDPSAHNLVVAVDSSATAEALAPVVADWSGCFGARPWIVQTLEPALVPAAPSGDAAESGLVHRAADLLALRGVKCSWDILHGRHPVDALVDFTARQGGGIVVAGTRRWIDPDRLHWGSTARRLVHSSPYPVLVVPLDDAARNQHQPSGGRPRQWSSSP